MKKKSSFHFEMDARTAHLFRKWARKNGYTVSEVFREMVRSKVKGHGN